MTPDIIQIIHFTHYCYQHTNLNLPCMSYNLYLCPALYQRSGNYHT
jgi:hypothetical protein